MRKKGFFGEAGGWILGLLLVFIIISILVSPKKLYAQAKDAVFNFGSNFLPKEKFPQSSGENRFSSELEQYYKSLASKIKNSGAGSNCWIKIDKMPKMDGFGITLYNEGIGIQKISSRGLTPPEKSEPIENFKPCSIKGVKAKNFYDCAIKKVKCPDAYEEEKSIMINEKLNIAEFLFKFDNSHICVVYLDGNDINIEKIQKVYPDCSKTPSMQAQTSQPAMQTNEQTNKNLLPPKEEFSRLITFLENLNLESYQSLCRKDFTFDTRKLSTGLYILFNNDGQVTLKINNEGIGNIIETSNIKYLPYEELVGPDETSIYFNDYNLLKHSFIISPAGDYAPSDLSDRIVQDSSIIAVAYENKWILTIPNLYVTKIPICKSS